MKPKNSPAAAPSVSSGTAAQPAGPDALQPLALPLTDKSPFWTQRIAWWTWAFVALGIAVRLMRYLLRFPLWGDEMMLAENFLDRGYADCLQPLHNNQCAPLLFLWTELTAIKVLGFSEWSLRLFPTLCSIGGVLLFRQLAGRILQGLPLLLAVAIFAVSYYPIRHGAEVKPYASDLTASLLLLVLAAEWLRNPAQTRWLWLLAAATPVAIGFSFPAVFVAGGISLGLAWRALSGTWQTRGALAVFNVAIAGSFLLFAWLSFQGQYQDSGAYMRRYWADSFPPLTDPLKLAAWLVTTHAGEMFAYPFGGERCGSILTTLASAAGAWLLLRRRQFALLGAFAGIFALAFTAASLQRYPYGDNARLVQYLAPPICLLAGLGWAASIAAVRSAAYQRWSILGATAALGLCGIGIAGFDLVHPYKHHVDLVQRGFAQWFWTSYVAGADVVVLPTDSSAGSTDRCSYRCWQKIYAPPHTSAPNTAAPQPALAASDKPRPIRCVLYYTTGTEPDAGALGAWLQTMQKDYDFVARQRFAVKLTIPNRAAVFGDYDVFEFNRRAAPAVAHAPAAPARPVPRR